MNTNNIQIVTHVCDSRLTEQYLVVPVSECTLNFSGRHLVCRLLIYEYVNIVHVDCVTD